MKLSLKILVGYTLLLLIIGSMIGIIVYERKRMSHIEMDVTEIRQVRSDINTVHRYITQLALLGEGGMKRTAANTMPNACAPTAYCKP